jgi:hypothetical protein
MASLTEHFVQIIPRHQRLLERLIEQQKVDIHGGIGWRGLLEGDQDLTMDQLFVPLLDRGLIEDLTAVPDFGPKAGTYFVRITPVGKLCAAYGYMLKTRHKSTEKEVHKYLAELPRPETPPPPQAQELFDQIKATQDAADRACGANPQILQGLA